MKKIFLLISLMSLPLFAETVEMNTAVVQNTSVYAKSYNAPVDEVYEKLKSALSKAHLVVVSEVDILAKFKRAGLPEKFGKTFNTNHLTAIKTLIACNGKFGNGISNADPEMMAFCPIRITVIEKEGKTTVTYVRPTTGTEKSEAFKILQALEKKVIETIDSL